MKVLIEIFIVIHFLHLQILEFQYAVRYLKVFLYSLCQCLINCLMFF